MANMQLKDEIAVLEIEKAKSDNRFIKIVTFSAAIIAIAITVLMGLFLLVEAWPSLLKNGFFRFIFSTKWSPLEEVYGIFTSLAGTLFTIAGSIAIGVPLAIFSAVFISKYTKGTVKTILNQAIALFAGIPSVIYGFFGIVVLLPAIKTLFGLESSGHGLLASVLVLAFMIVPTIINVTVNSLDSVDNSFVDASTAMGATKNQSIFTTVLPAAKRGIIVACILGIGKALGEGIALSMVCGNSIAFPEGLFKPFNTMTTLIFSQLSESSPSGKNALFACGVVLFLFTLGINLLVNKAGKESGSGGKLIRKIRSLITGKKETIGKTYKTVDMSKKSGSMPDFSDKKNSKLKSDILMVLSAVFFGLVFAVFTGIIFYILFNGLSFVSLKMLFGSYSAIGKTVTIFSEIRVTLYMILLTLIICIPLGVAAALYLCEYANEDSKVIKAIRFSIQVLSGAPGIIIGLMGYMLFVQSQIFGRGYSVLAGVLTLCIISLPTVIKTCENAFRSVPQDYEDASLAMGASRARTIWRIVLPQALTGIFSAIILTIAKVVSESAALIFTSGTSKANNFNLYGSGASLAVSMYIYAMKGTADALGLAYAIGVVIIAIVVLINLAMLFLHKSSKKIQRGE